jgi:hypothetical protein
MITAFKLCFRFQPTPLRHGVHARAWVPRARRQVRGGRRARCQVPVGGPRRQQAEVVSQGRGIIENMHSTGGKSPPPFPPRGGSIQNKHSTDVESVPPSSECSVQVLLLHDPPALTGRLLRTRTCPTMILLHHLRTSVCAFTHLP